MGVNAQSNLSWHYQLHEVRIGLIATHHLQSHCLGKLLSLTLAFPLAIRVCFQVVEHKSRESAKLLDDETPKSRQFER